LYKLKAQNQDLSAGVLHFVVEEPPVEVVAPPKTIQAIVLTKNPDLPKNNNRRGVIAGYSFRVKPLKKMLKEEYLGQPLTMDTIERVQEEILSFYRKSGRSLPTVTAQNQDLSAGVLHFVVEEPPVEVAEKMAPLKTIQAIVLTKNPDLPKNTDLKGVVLDFSFLLQPLKQKLKWEYLGQPLAWNTVERIREEILSYYRESDHPLPNVQIYAQDISSGVIHFVVEEPAAVSEEVLAKTIQAIVITKNPDLPKNNHLKGVVLDFSFLQEPLKQKLQWEYLGKPLTWDTIERIREEITSFYRKSGRSLPSVEVYEQDLSAGVIHFVIPVYRPG
jgi:hemolysin activation/secretion protein